MHRWTILALLACCPRSAAADACADATIRRATLPAVIAEASGMAPSAIDAEVVWLHNDSGDTARVFGVTLDGDLVATVTLAGVVAWDWEDMAAGPCGDQRCLYIGDIGDNAGYFGRRRRSRD